MVEGLHHIALLCAEEERSLRFYRTLGFEVFARHERPERGDVILMLRNGSVVLELFVGAPHPPRPSGPEAYGLRHLALFSRDADKVRTDLLRAGYSPEEIRRDTFDGQKMFFVKDPDGQPIEIHE